jgi:5-methylcytosine-specific restriction endonuclease McrA
MSTSYANGIELSESDSAVREASAECPKCGKELANVAGMSTHHTRSHGGYVYLVKDCAGCGGEIAKRLSDYNENADKHYCSNECMSAWRSENCSGEQHPRWNSDQPVVDCCICGDPVRRPQSYVDQHDKITCSKECRSEVLSDIMSKENNPNWKDNSHTTSKCGHCEEEFEHVISRDRSYCSRSCRAKDRTGKEAPNWKGGWESEYYGPNWEEQRDRALERDGNECVYCGVSQDDAKGKTGSPLHVHHRQRKETFRDGSGNLDYESANALSNLITLCVVCHGMWEEIPVQPEAE